MIILIFLFHLITKMNDDEIYNFGMILMNFHLHKERVFCFVLFFFFFETDVSPAPRTMPGTKRELFIY